MEGTSRPWGILQIEEESWQGKHRWTPGAVILFWITVWVTCAGAVGYLIIMK